MRPTRTPEVREQVIARLEACYKKWSDCYNLMMGTLYKPIVMNRYLTPLGRKIAELKRPGTFVR